MTWLTSGCILVRHSLFCLLFPGSHTEHSQKLFPHYGTTSFLATVVLPRDHPNTHATLGVLNERSGKTGHGAVLEGIHAEVLNILTTLGQMEVFRDLYFLGWEKVSREVSSVHT